MRLKGQTFGIDEYFIEWMPPSYTTSEIFSYILLKCNYLHVPNNFKLNVPVRIGIRRTITH